MKKKFTILIIACMVIMGCATTKVTGSSISDRVTFTVKLAKKAKTKDVEKEIQYWSSAKVRCAITTNVDDFDVDENGVIIETKGEQQKVFIIPKNTPGKLIYIKNGIYWIQFDKEDERLAPFKRQCADSTCIYSLAVQTSDKKIVVLSDNKRYKRRGDAHLEVSKKFANDNGKDIKVATGVKVNGEE